MNNRAKLRGKVVSMMLAGAIACAATIASAVHPSPASAIIGRPFTPMSYAGVARRTTRRAVVGTAVVAGSVAYANRAAYVNTLPAGCVTVHGVYQCGSANY